MDPLSLVLLDQGFPVEYELDEFSTPHTGTTLRHPPKLAMSTAMQNLTPTPSDYFTSGQHFLETFTPLPETSRTTNSRWLLRLSPQTANTTLATLMANISLSHVQRHVLLSQLCYNFKSFTYFFPSYETCSINVNSLFHAAIKNLHVKANGIFVFLLLHPPLLTTTISEGITHTQEYITFTK